MVRHTALRAILLGTLAFASCSDGPPAPSPVPANPGPPPGTGGNSNPASGLYGLTLTIGPSCTILPEAERTRQYSARLADDGPGRYVVTLGDASFMEAPGCIPLRCNQFRAVDEGDAMRLILDPDNEWHGGYMTEKMTSGTWLILQGLLSAVRHPSLIEASGAANVGYCRTAGSQYSFPCSDYVSCDADLKLVFAKN